MSLNTFISCRVPGEFCCFTNIFMFWHVVWLSSVNVSMEIVYWIFSMGAKHGYRGDERRRLKPFVEAYIEDIALIFHSCLAMLIKCVERWSVGACCPSSGLRVGSHVLCLICTCCLKRLEHNIRCPYFFLLTLNMGEKENAKIVDCNGIK